MQYAVLRVCGQRTVVALVERWQLNSRHAPSLVGHLEDEFSLPAILVARDDSTWRTARAYSAGDLERALFELLAVGADIEWSEVTINSSGM